MRKVFIMLLIMLLVLMGANIMFAESLDRSNLGMLKTDRVVLSPFEAFSSVGISLSLDGNYPDARVIVTDISLKVVGSFDLDYKEVLVDGHLRHTYKGVLSGLEPGKTYRFVIDTGSEKSYIHTLRTLPDKEAINMVFFGDCQGYNEAQYIAFKNSFEVALKHVKRMDLAYIAGDIVDNGDSLFQWKQFDLTLNSYGSNRLWLSAIGNHDVKGNSKIYESTFNFPNNGVEGLDERNYYIDLPYGRIFSLDTESPELFNDQVKWLQENSDIEGHKIVLMHRSVYPLMYNEPYVRTFSKVFDEIGVDLVLSGHDHIYSRTVMGGGVKDADGVTYIIGGSSSGSKYYSAMERPWAGFVYDDNDPIFTVLNISDDYININAYAIIDGETILIDSIILK